MATTTRAIWNGAISFGLVNIPVELHPATSETGLDFDWIDKRTMDLVGYKRINKQTGQEIEKGNIVKGIAFEKGRYVLLSDDEIRTALPKSTQTIEIDAFVSASEIPLLYFERPYYMVPSGTSKKAYMLLRETLLKTGQVGVARVVIHTKQHLAAILPVESVLVLILLRWADQIRPSSDLELPVMEEAELTERETSMAAQLVQAMTEPWNPEKFKDSFSDKIRALVAEKVRTDKVETVIRSEEKPEYSSQEDLIDFTELLRRSLQVKIPG